MAEETGTEEAGGDVADAATGATVAADSAAPGLTEVSAWIGSRLDDLRGTAMGKVDGAYVDDETGRPEWLLVRLGRFGQRSLVPAREAVGGVGRVWVPYEREVIRNSPKVDGKSAITCDWERSLLAYFGIAGEIGRAAELAERNPETITARPAS